MPESVYGLQLTEGQARAVNMAERLLCESGTQVALLTGYAGTGKTTVIRSIANATGGVLLLTPTGKAAVRVREATGLDGRTIHRWLFKPIENQETGEVTFEKRAAEELERPESGLIIVDEASMVDAQVCDALVEAAEELECHILFVGDPFQLPPVERGGDGSVFSVFDPSHQSFDRVMLTEVVRQALDSAIVRASIAVREGDVSAGLAMLPHVEGDLLGAVAEYNEQRGVVICHKNVTRQYLNEQMRARKHYRPDTIEPFEPILVLRNCYELPRFNGEVIHFWNWKSQLSKEVEIYDKYRDKKVVTKFGVANITGDEVMLALAGVHGQAEGIGFKPFMWGRLKAARKMYDFPEAERVPFLMANFGYALTCHKAQGSEWDRVLVYLEQSVRARSEEGRRWLYTALTRAKKDLALFIE